MTNTVEITTNKLDADIEEYKRRGYRLDMIVPADAPREAVLSAPPAVPGGLSSAITTSDLPRTIHLKPPADGVRPPAGAGGTDTSHSEWITGRAGMEYRDLIPDRLGGKIIASHIRLTTGGEVPDYVHYHKVDFQMIYCKRGRIKVVYEDQGPPFWLETGDCVLQPPEIRHRVLYAEAGAEVIEVSMPAEHETWVEHDITLPTSELKPDRDFGGQQFIHYTEDSSPFRGSGYLMWETGITKASNENLWVSIYRFEDRDNNSRDRGWFSGKGTMDMVYILQGELESRASKSLPSSFEDGQRFIEGDCLVLPQGTAFTFDWSPDLKLLSVGWRG